MKRNEVLIFNLKLFIEVTDAHCMSSFREENTHGSPADLQPLLEREDQS